MEHRDHQHGDGLAEVEHAHDARVREQLPRLAQVSVGHARLAAIPPAGQQRTGVRDDNRVVIDIHHPGLVADLAQHLARGPPRGDTGTDIEELGDALTGQETHRAAEKLR
jgi:hypothetical protein